MKKHSYVKSHSPSPDKRANDIIADASKTTICERLRMTRCMGSVFH